jgi:integrase
MLQRPSKALPDKPYPDFPLRPHARGKWTKKIGGKSYYFGTWDDPYAALREYESFVAGNGEPKATTGELNLIDAADLFLESKQSQVNEGTLVKRTLEEYVNTCQRFIEQMGRTRRPQDLRPADFGAYRTYLVATKKYGIVTVSNEIVRVKVLMNWIHKTYFPGTLAQFGPSFDAANRKSMRKHKSEQKSKLLAPETIHAILDESGVHFRAMVLLGINCGFGPTDCSRLPLKIAQDAIATGWLVFPRTKTFVKREAALWPETIAALADSIDRRPSPKTDDAKKACFVTPKGQSYDHDGRGVAALVQGRWKAAKKQATIEHGSFYCLRHTFNTIAEQTGDQIAVKLVMGHTDGSMSENYRHATGTRSIDDKRLIMVSKAVREWLYPSKKPTRVGVSPLV